MDEKGYDADGRVHRRASIRATSARPKSNPAGRRRQGEERSWAGCRRSRFDELVAEMVREDLKAAERDELVKKHGYRAPTTTTSSRMDKTQESTSPATAAWSARRSCARLERQRRYTNLLLRTHAELELTDQARGARVLRSANGPSTCSSRPPRSAASSPTTPTRPNSSTRTWRSRPTSIHEAWRAGVKRLLFLGSSCIYPRDCPQPMKEEYLLTGPLEPTNRALRDRQDRGHRDVLSPTTGSTARTISRVMPTNLYGPGDNYDLENSHVLPALIRKIHEAKARATRR